MANKILYVEDEPFLAKIVSDGLRSSGYELIHASDGQLALQHFIKERPQLCLLDVMLPMKDGYTLATEIRKVDPKVPILFLSAKTLTEDVIKGFKSGGNDYMRKPFSIDELLIRIEALLGRIAIETPLVQKENQRFYEFGNCRLDTLLQELHTSGGSYKLSFKEVALLEIMLQHKNTLIERQRILQEIWGDDSYYNTRSMDVFLSNLRKYLKSEPAIQLINIRGVGYKFIC